MKQKPIRQTITAIFVCEIHSQYRGFPISAFKVKNVTDKDGRIIALVAKLGTCKALSALNPIEGDEITVEVIVNKNGFYTNLSYPTNPQLKHSSFRIAQEKREVRKLTSHELDDCDLWLNNLEKGGNDGSNNSTDTK